MRISSLLLALAGVGLTARLASATPRVELDADFDGLASSTWYLRVNFDEMRRSQAGSGLYRWIEKSIFKEIEGETGIALASDLEQLTAYATANAKPVVVLVGPLRQAKREILKKVNEPRRHVHDGAEYIEIQSSDFNDDDIDLDGPLFLSFAIPNRLLIAFESPSMIELLDNAGRIPVDSAGEQPLMVLSAERDLVQAGAKQAGFDQDGVEWRSKILRNTKQIAVLLADAGEKLSVAAKLEATEPELAESMGNIVKGLIGLAHFSDELGPGLSEMLRTVRVEVLDGLLELNLEVDPRTFVTALEE